MQASSILAVIVLYQCELSQSQAFSSFLQILTEDAGLAKHFSLILYDNSQQSQSADCQASFPIEYIHDPANGGLACAYNFALSRAQSSRQPWLLLFDQDTSPTRDFFVELVQAAAALHPQHHVGAIVPKLLVHGKIYSPEPHFFIQLRRQPRPIQLVKREVIGVQQQHLNAYNSGATLRVSALQSIGGFPPEFWLDYLDHAVFNALFVHGFRVYVMQAELAHQVSLAEFKTIPAWRLRNIVMAQTLFVKRSGTFLDRLLYRIFLLRFSRSLWSKRKDTQIWRHTALQAFLLRVEKSPRSTRNSIPPVS